MQARIQSSRVTGLTYWCLFWSQDQRCALLCWDNVQTLFKPLLWSIKIVLVSRWSSSLRGTVSYWFVDI
jgi:hypothetical protein